MIKRLRLLFVGGPLHGQERDVDPAPVTIAAARVNDVTVPEPEPSAQYVDVASGATYVLETMRVPVKRPLADEPEGFLERDLYLFGPLYGDVTQSHAALADALTRVWLTGGRRITAEQAAEQTEAAEQVLYVVTCEDCKGDAVLGEVACETLRGRAEWAAGHLDVYPGHKLSFREEPRSVTR